MTASSYVVAFVLAAGAGACGGDEVFVPRLADSERLLDTIAVARLAKDDQRIGQAKVVGDLDGDGVDDVVFSTSYVVRTPDNSFPSESDVYVLYGGSAASGPIDLANLPRLTGAHGYGSGVTVGVVGDVDGDGLADVLVTAARGRNCVGYESGPGEDIATGAYLIYGSATRLTGSQWVGAAAVFLRDPTPCSNESAVVGLGDLDGDGKGDFAIARRGDSEAEVFVFYGRAERATGVIDMRATADAVITSPTSDGYEGAVARLGDVDGDGHSDFMLSAAIPDVTDLRLVRGSATRLAGRVTPAEISSTLIVGNEPCFDDIGAALGDLDGDGTDDFALASCHETRGPGGFDATMSQRVFYGHRDGFAAQVQAGSADATITLSAESPNGIAGGDVDGDGVRDLIVGDSSLHGGNGGVHVIKGDGTRLAGNVDPSARATTYVGTSQRGSQCSYVLSPDCVTAALVGFTISVGDVTGDHVADVLTLAPSNQLASAELDVHGSSQGAVYLVSPSETNP